MCRRSCVWMLKHRAGNGTSDCWRKGLRGLLHLLHLAGLDCARVCFRPCRGSFGQVRMRQSQPSVANGRAGDLLASGGGLCTNSGALCFWWERDPTSIRRHCWKNGANLTLFFLSIKKQFCKYIPWHIRPMSDMNVLTWIVLLHFWPEQTVRCEKEPKQLIKYSSV